MDIANAINNWFYFSNNYEVAYYPKYDDCFPCFLFFVEWTCNVEHILEKWKDIEHNNPMARMNYFYAGLDSANRRLLVEWVTTQYNCGMRI